MKLIKGFLYTLILFTAQSAAQAQTPKMPTHIQTSSEAVINAEPDQARIDIGVVTEASNSQTAVKQNAEKVEKTLMQVKKLLNANDEVKTVKYVVSPKYNYPEEGGEPSIVGYTASNIIRVTLKDFTKIGNIIDTATQNGANRIENLEFMLKDDRAAKAKVLAEAALKAREKAKILADTLDIKITRVLSVVENDPTVISVQNVSYIRTEKDSTPIEPGMIEVRAVVTVTVEVN